MIPTGEVYPPPPIRKTNGIVIFDGAISTYWCDVVAEKHVRVEIRDGFCEKIT